MCLLIVKLLIKQQSTEEANKKVVIVDLQSVEDNGVDGDERYKKDCQ